MPAPRPRPSQDHLQPASTQISTGTPSPARVYDHLLGGKDNYGPDREFVAALPKPAQLLLRRLAHDNRSFLGRAVRHLATSAGIRQFIDIGTGLPTRDNVHQIAQRHTPGTRVVYVDNDPVVLAHARALLTSTPQGRTAYIDADARDTPAIVDGAAQAGVDLSRPVAVLLVAVLHLIDDAEAVAAPLRQAVAPGSQVVISHGVDCAQMAEVAAAYRQHVGMGTPRTVEEIAGLFGGWPMADPGLVGVAHWRPDRPRPAQAHDGLVVGGIARKPAAPAPGPGRECTR
ncbi:SAM-dependent methyltransferase [Actinomadura graeca]|uniref:SAM-dependent methyltransferase n=2 Tax=Actinomadura graeca TaxID=2750812 RepID=A0ABX8R9K3_9ACTN|nr:SAM-dependent methyltransferase [Actinomadura graeca]